EAVPGRASVAADDSTVDLPLQLTESRAQHFLEFLAPQYIELLLRVVQVIDIDDGKAEVLATALDLVVDVPRCEAMSAGNDIARTHDASGEILVFKKGPISFPGRRRIAVERYV